MHFLANVDYKLCLEVNVLCIWCGPKALANFMKTVFQSKWHVINEKGEKSYAI